MKTQGYKNVVTVAKSGGDFTSIQDALGSITDASPTNHYLVWVGPGVYSEQVTMKEYVDIEGSGEQATKITWTGTDDYYYGTVIGVDHAELRSLTVESIVSSGSLFALAISNEISAPSLRNVTAIASGNMDSYGIYNNSSSSPSMNNVTVIASSSLTSGYGIYNANHSSPNMTDVTITSSGSGNNVGVYNSGSSPTMNNVTITVAPSNGSSGSSRGVSNDHSSPTMNNVTVTVTGGSGSFNGGVYDDINSSASMNNVTVAASGGNSNFGVYNAASVITVSNSTLTGSTSSILSTSGSTARVRGSQLIGGHASAGVICAGVYDANFGFYANSCP